MDCFTEKSKLDDETSVLPLKAIFIIENDWVYNRVYPLSKGMTFNGQPGTTFNITNEYTTFITVIAYGVDILAGLIVVWLYQSGSYLHLIAM